MTDHTPTPWQISDARTTENTAMIVGGEGFEFGLIADVTEDFDATFIVKAANAHDALVTALKFYADPDNWRLNRACDPNSGNFSGQTMAEGALAKVQS